MAADTMTLLALAQSILTGAPLAKAEGADDPDALKGGATASEEELEAARKEAQAAAAAAPAPGEGGGGEAGAAPGEGGGEAPGETNPDREPDNDPDDVAKAEILGSMKFLAESHKISPEEVVKAFSGLEGDPTQGKAPVGAGVEILQKIVEGQENQNKILAAIAETLAGLSKHQVSLSEGVAKAIEGADIAKAEATKAAASIAEAIKAAPAAPQKAELLVAKGLPEGKQALSSDSLFKMALAGELSPTDAAAANRLAHYGNRG